jgi:hypothetical protein
MKKLITSLFVLSSLSLAAEEAYHSFYISNHDQSPSHRIIHPIVGKTNFVYDAKGAKEVVKGEAIAFLVKDSERVTIRNLTLDWERPAMTEARITGFDGNDTIVEIDRSRCPMIVDGGKFYISCEERDDIVASVKGYINPHDTRENI